MRWLLVERKPDVVYAGRQDVYLGSMAGKRAIRPRP